MPIHELYAPYLHQMIEGKKKVIFHCVYSMSRGPTAAREYAEFMEAKSITNAPQIYVLQGFQGPRKSHVGQERA